MKGENKDGRWFYESKMREIHFPKIIYGNNVLSSKFTV